MDFPMPSGALRTLPIAYYMEIMAYPMPPGVSRTTHSEEHMEIIEIWNKIRVPIYTNCKGKEVDDVYVTVLSVKMMKMVTEMLIPLSRRHCCRSWRRFLPSSENEKEISAPPGVGENHIHRHLIKLHKIRAILFWWHKDLCKRASIKHWSRGKISSIVQLGRLDTP